MLPRTWRLAGALSSQLGSVTVSSVPDEQSSEVGGVQNTVSDLKHLGVQSDLRSARAEGHLLTLRDDAWTGPIEAVQADSVG